MELKQLVEKADLGILKERILFCEPMKNHTTFKIGGPAECFIKVKSIKELKNILNFVKENDVPITILGNGSNILVLESGISGITVQINIDEIEIIKNESKIEINVGAGAKMGKLAQVLANEGISGFEELSGIPGTIGGAVYMNAGAHGKEMKDIVKYIKCIDYNGNESILQNKELNFSYRNSILKKKNKIVVGVVLELEVGKENEIREKMQQYKTYRKEKQPIEYPSAGSTFKRGKDFVTAQLIDEAGLKGYSVGDAEVSIKHSGFIINKGNATADDVLELVKYVKEEVRKKYNKDIELEIEIIGEK